MKKKIFAIVLCVAMLAIAVVGGSLAYFTDNDADVNTMVSGEVKIRQDEWMRDITGENLTPYVDQTLLPAVVYDAEGKVVNGDPTDYEWWCKATVDDTDVVYQLSGLTGGFLMPDNDRLANMVDKVVTVTNTGKNDAYIRTILLIEDDGNNTVINNVNWQYDEKITNVHYVNDLGNIQVGSKHYSVAVYTYDDIISPEETTLPSMMAFWMNPLCEQGTVPTSFQVVAFSQAVQADGFKSADDAFAAAFGDIKTMSNEEVGAKLATWIGIS